jgi:ATP-dependent exoDNAse (exonuclease V) beta subunit
MFTHEFVELTPLSTTTIDGKRHYQTPDGQVYPSVTTITSLHGKEGILEWRKRVGEEEANKISNKAATRGTRVHKLCEDYLNNELSFEGAMPNSIALFKQMQPFLDKYIGKVYGIECPLYSHHLRVAGKSDCIAQFDGKNAVVDFKTANKPKQEHWIQNYFMQCAAYAVAFEERTGIPVPRIAIVVAVEGDSPQLFVKKRDDYVDMFISYRKQYDEQLLLG